MGRVPDANRSLRRQVRPAICSDRCGEAEVSGPDHRDHIRCKHDSPPRHAATIRTDSAAEVSCRNGAGAVLLGTKLQVVVGRFALRPRRSVSELPVGLFVRRQEIPPGVLAIAQGTLDLHLESVWTIAGPARDMHYAMLDPEILAGHPRTYESSSLEIAADESRRDDKSSIVE